MSTYLHTHVAQTLKVIYRCAGEGVVRCCADLANETAVNFVTPPRHTKEAIRWDTKEFTLEK